MQFGIINVIYEFCVWMTWWSWFSFIVFNFTAHILLLHSDCGAIEAKALNTVATMPKMKMLFFSFFFVGISNESKTFFVHLRIVFVSSSPFSSHINLTRETEMKCAELCFSIGWYFSAQHCREFLFIWHRPSCVRTIEFLMELAASMYENVVKIYNIYWL